MISSKLQIDLDRVLKVKRKNDPQIEIGTPRETAGVTAGENAK
jgi:hypothetical protein